MDARVTSAPRSYSSYLPDPSKWNIHYQGHLFEHILCDDTLPNESVNAGAGILGTESMGLTANGISFTSRRSVFAPQGLAPPGQGAPSPPPPDGGIIDSGMVLPFEPLSLTFSHVNYYVPMPKVTPLLAPDSGLLPPYLCAYYA